MTVEEGPFSVGVFFLFRRACTHVARYSPERKGPFNPIGSANLCAQEAPRKYPINGERDIEWGPAATDRENRPQCQPPDSSPYRDSSTRQFVANSLTPFLPSSAPIFYCKYQCETRHSLSCTYSGLKNDKVEERNENERERQTVTRR